MSYIFLNRDSNQGKLIVLGCGKVCLFQEMLGLTRGEFGWSEGGMTTIEIMQHDEF